MGRTLTNEEKAERALRAYFDLIDAGADARTALPLILGSCRLTMEGFRLMELLYREGPTEVTVAAVARRRNRQNMDATVAMVKRRGYVRRKLMMVRPKAETGGKHVLAPWRKGDPPRRKRSVVSLTEQGRTVVEWLLPWAEKAAMVQLRRASVYEQIQLRRICRKLLEDDGRLEMSDWEETEESEEAVEVSEE